MFVFMPVAWAMFWSLNVINKRSLAFLSLTLMSWVFYAYWKPLYLLLLVSSIGVNYYAAKRVNDRGRHCKLITTLGIVFNLCLLGYFKYTLFFTDNLGHIFDFIKTPSDIFLPLGISFFTFQQITYLCDLYQGKIKKASFANYALFVSFFPQLIAGPIVHAKEMIPQFVNWSSHVHFWPNMAKGLSIFIVGLFKKVVIADNLAVFASPVFENAGTQDGVAFFEAWSGALAYTFQLYFDFSGYCDMAIGLALMFGIVLPINFLSPYKSLNIIDFWRRWHITMSRFFKEYVYIPLGGNRTSGIKNIRNLFATMLIAGLWHGAGWTFIIWGILHGLFLIINHLYLQSRKLFFPDKVTRGIVYKVLAHILTMLCIVFAWVIFRSEDMNMAQNMMRSMLGFNDIILPRLVFERFIDLGTDGFLRFGVYGEAWLNNSYWCLPWIVVSYLLCLLLPASAEYFGLVDDEVERERETFYERQRYIFVLIAIMAVISVLSMQKVSEFLYFQF
jgi:D-alanyl-lipoteichoic acid acyltransferase DltB (MBOAT superfamily)